jgi:hypothetical protein
MKRLFLFAWMCLIAFSINAQQETRKTVEVVNGYLKIFPKELGEFNAEPIDAIAQINEQVQYGYNNWRIPTSIELSFIREANKYLGAGQYMTTEKKKGILLLVSDGDDFATIQKENEEIRKVVEARRKACLTQGYVDLGLPSGTLWKKRNEEGLYYFPEAISLFGAELPSSTQFFELKNNCSWTWIGNGYKVTGPNGNYIILPAEGYQDCSERMHEAGKGGYYWSFTPHPTQDLAWFLIFHADGVGVYDQGWCYGRSVRLVHTIR